MAKIFLSHSSADKEHYVRHIAKNLIESLGEHNVVYDEVTFEEGMMPLEEINRSLDITDLFVIFLSQKSLESDWVKYELSKANELKDNGIINRIYPIIIDNTISYSDKRIPQWMRDSYNIKPIYNIAKAFKMIKERSTQITWINYPKLKEKDQIFVGRNDYIKRFEERFYSIDEDTLNVVIASGIKNIGRETLLRKCLRQVNAIKENSYEMSTITLNSMESLEDFIHKIYDLGFSDNINIENLINTSIDKKIDMALNLINDIQKNKEIIHIEDEGCIVTHNGKVAEWFLSIVTNLKFKSRVTFTIASKFRVTSPDIWKYQSIYTMEVGEFQKKEIIGLFKRYLEFEEIELEDEDFKSILNLLTGYPEQVHYAVFLIKRNGIRWVKENLNLIVEFSNEKVLTILKDIEDDKDMKELLVLLCNFDYIGYDFILEIVEDKSKCMNYISEFINRSICEYVGTNKEYIKVNLSIKDYIQRSNVRDRSGYTKKMNEIIKEKLMNVDSYASSTPEYLFMMKQAIIDGKDIDEKYLIPSHYLSVMNELYIKRKNYQDVIKFADKALEKVEYMESNIVFEIRYLLCLSLARLKDKRFLSEVQHIEGADHDFLLAYYYRLTNKYDRALERLKSSLEKRKNFTKAKRELVQVYINLQEYTKAKELAKENYENEKSNPYHVQAYFSCLINGEKSESTRGILNELILTLEKIESEVSKEMVLRCRAQFEAFYNENEEEAIIIINSAITKYPKLHYALSVKFEICNKFNRLIDMEEIITRLEKDNYSREHHSNQITYYKAVLIAKTDGSSKAIEFVEKNLKNYTDEALERVKVRLQKLNNVSVRI
ncbi:TIR domain-containing protein [Clostridium sp.]|uniref:TIR domain-containing protein n=1 Tax=Clostridium sp. TaxID=1506 RepID=UPI00291310BA|nr:TIR domain-containing protein [Clostridium sp.]MDU6542866.1 TIR domain-containing protein [Clostridium sp.]